MPHFSDMTIREFLEQAASNAPVPGGGGIAALAGALGASMASMAANFTVGKEKYAEHDALMRETLATLAPLIEELRDGIDADAEAFSGIAAAYKLPRSDDEEKARRKAAIRDALTASMRVPLAILDKCLQAARLLPRLAETANPNLLSDVEVAAVMLEAAARAARINVLVNSGQLDSDEAEVARVKTDQAVDQAAWLAAKTLEEVAKRRDAAQ